MRGLRSGRRSITTIVLVTVALAASACGTRWSEEERALQMARLHGGSAQATGTGSATRTGSGSTAGTQSVAVSGGGTTGSATGGDATGSGSSGDATGNATNTSLPCRAPSDAPGVTDTELTVGTINSLSGPVPGLGASSLAASEAYVAYRNSIGGVCGRQIVLRSADDGGDNGINRSAMADLERQALGIIGGIAGAGDGGVDIVISKNVPVVGAAVTPQLQAAPQMYWVRPPLPDYHVPTPKYRYLYDQGVRKAAIVYIAAAAAPHQAEDIERPQIEASGIQVVLDLAMPLSTLSWDSTARAVANSGAEYLLFIHASEASAAMAQAMVDTGYKLKFGEYIVAYGSNFIDLAGSAAEGATSWLDTLPVEDGGVVAEQATFLKWMDQISPDAAKDTFAMETWAGAKAFFDTLEALPGPISREAMLTQLAATGTYDAGGLLGPIELGAKRSSGCLIGVIVQNGAWRRLTPATGFLC